MRGPVLFSPTKRLPAPFSWLFSPHQNRTVIGPPLWNPRGPRLPPSFSHSREEPGGGRRIRGAQSGSKWGIVGDWGATAVFLGEYEHSLDEKGRLTIPSRFREELTGRLVVTRGLDHCLFLYPYSEWQVLGQKLRDLPMTQRDARAFVRLLFSGATEQSLDRQGRLLLPANLREYAGIERDVVILGLSNRVELWSKDRWAAYEAEASQSYEELAEKIVDLGL